MQLSFTEAEELLSDESFLAWYFKTDPKKEAEWKKHLANNPTLSRLAEEAVQLLQVISIKDTSVSSNETSAAEQRLMNAIGKEQRSSAVVAPIRKRRTIWWSAAAAALIAVAGWAAWQYFSEPGQLLLQTQYGEIKNEVLPDGSHVTLNANTKISYNKDWQKSGEREVWMEGEAFFQVEKTNPKTKFIVHSGKFDVIVTGTQFNVVNRKNRNSVLLKEGSVILRTTTGEEMHLKPGDYAEYKNARLGKKLVNDTPVIAWKESKFIFEKTPMNEVASQITEMYGIKVMLADEAVSSTPISGVFPNDNLDIFLKSLEVSQNFEIQKTAQEILIRKK